MKPLDLRTLHHRDLRSFAISLGWTIVDVERSDITLLESPSGKPGQLLIPTDPQLRDYGLRMEEAVAKLASSEQTAVYSIISQLVQSRMDRLRILIGKDDANVVIPLESGLKILKGIRTTLISAALNIEKPQPYYQRLRSRKAHDFLRNCQLGQTEIGSFIFNVTIPYRLNPQQDIFGEHKAPFSRLALLYLMKSTEFLVKSIESDSIDRILTPTGTQPMVSFNLCTGLLDMNPNGSYPSICFEAGWSSREGPDIDSVTIPAEYQPDIEMIAEELRPETEVETTFVGIVDNLRGNPNPSLQVEGSVDLIILDGDNQIRTKVKLDHEDYLVAIAAHSSVKNIAIDGVLQRIGNKITIAEYRNFRLI